MDAKACMTALAQYGNPDIQFLDKHAATMPRTTLRYAIEHLSSAPPIIWLKSMADSIYR